MPTPLPALEKNALVLWLAVLAVLFLVVPSYQRTVVIGVWLLVAVIGGAVLEGLRRRAE